MTYEVIILGHLHMPLYFIGTFTEYPYLKAAPSKLSRGVVGRQITTPSFNESA